MDKKNKHILFLFVIFVSIVFGMILIKSDLVTTQMNRSANTMEAIATAFNAEGNTLNAIPVAESENQFKLYVDSGGGQIIHSTGIQITVPEFAIFEETRVNIANVQYQYEDAPILSAYSIDSTQELFEKPISLELPYPDQLPPEYGESDLFAIFKVDDHWVYAGGEVLTDKNKIRVETDHLSIWGVIGDKKTQSDNIDVQPHLLGINSPETVISGQPFSMRFSAENAGKSDLDGWGIIIVNFPNNPEMTPIQASQLPNWDGRDGFFSAVYISGEAEVPFTNLEEPAKPNYYMENTLDELTIVAHSLGELDMEVHLIFFDSHGNELARDRLDHLVNVVNIPNIVEQRVLYDGEIFRVRATEVSAGQYRYVVTNRNGIEVQIDSILYERVVFTAVVQWQINQENRELYQMSQPFFDAYRRAAHISDSVNYLVMRPGTFFLAFLSGTVRGNVHHAVKEVIEIIAEDVVKHFAKEIFLHPEGTSKDIALAYYDETYRRFERFLGIVESVQNGQELSYHEAKRYLGDIYFIGIYASAERNLLNAILDHKYDRDSIFNRGDIEGKAISEVSENLQGYDQWLKTQPSAQLATMGKHAENVYLLTEILEIAYEAQKGLMNYQPYANFKNEEQNSYSEYQIRHDNWISTHNFTLEEINDICELMEVICPFKLTSEFSVNKIISELSHSNSTPTPSPTFTPSYTPPPPPTITPSNTPTVIPTYTPSPSPTQTTSPTSESHQMYDSSELSTYIDEDNRFSFEYPKDFETYGCGISKFRGDIFLGQFITVELLDAGEMGLESFVNQLIDKKEWDLESSNWRTVDGESAIFIEFRFGGLGRGAAITFAKKGDLIVAFGLLPTASQCIPSQKIDEIAGYEQIISSFKFKNNISGSINNDDCEWDAKFITDITIPDGTVFKPGTSFTKTWRMKNTGNCSWTEDHILKFNHIDGSRMAASKSISISESRFPIDPGETIDVSVRFVAPNSSGAYKSWWQFSNNVTGLFGQHPYVEIEVKH